MHLERCLLSISFLFPKVCGMRKIKSDEKKIWGKKIILIKINLIVPVDGGRGYQIWVIVIIVMMMSTAAAVVAASARVTGTTPRTGVRRRTSKRNFCVTIQVTVAAIVMMAIIVIVCMKMVVVVVVVIVLVRMVVLWRVLLLLLVNQWVQSCNSHGVITISLMHKRMLHKFILDWWGGCSWNRRGWSRTTALRSVLMHEWGYWAVCTVRSWRIKIRVIQQLRSNWRWRSSSDRRGWTWPTFYHPDYCVCKVVAFFFCCTNTWASPTTISLRL